MEREGAQDKKPPKQKSVSLPDSNIQEPAPDQTPSPAGGLTWRQRLVLSSQQLHGNAKTGALIRRLKAEVALSAKKVTGSPVQLTAIAPGKLNETIVNQPVKDATNTNTIAMQTHDYSLTPGYTMSRRGLPKADVLISVHILFMDPPVTTGNDPTGKPIFPNPGGTVISAGDQRRTGVQPILQGLTGFWNDKYELVGHPATGGGATGGSATPSGNSATGGNNEIVLPLTFEAVAVWDPTQQHDNKDPVFLHGGADTGNAGRVDPNRSTQGKNPSTFGTAAIDAGNWYLARAPGQYGAAAAGAPAGTADPMPLAAIYAHEYGHLLGLPDEYSQSNPSTHAMLHRVAPNSPAEQARMDTGLDRATSKMIILDAMRPQLLAAINTISANVTTAVQTQQQLMITQLTTGLRTSWQSAEVNSALNDAISAQLNGQTHVQPVISNSINTARGVLDFATIAQQVVTSQLSGAAVGGIMRNLMTAAIDAAQNNGKVSIDSVGGPVDMTIHTTGILTDPALNQLRTDSQNAVNSLVGTTPTPTTWTTPVSPSQNLLDQLMSVPDQWKNMGSLFDPAAVNTSVQQAVTAVLADGSLPGAVNDQASQLAAALRTRFNQSAQAAGAQSINRFLNDQIKPHIQQQLDMILTEIANEPSTHTTATPTGTSGGANPPPIDPAMQLRVNQMHTAMQSVLAQARAVRDTAETTPGATPGAAPTRNNLHVDITTAGMMGSNFASQTIRPDYMSGIANAFNHPASGATDLRNAATESEFTVRAQTSSKPSPPGDYNVPPTTGPGGTALA